MFDLRILHYSTILKQMMLKCGNGIASKEFDIEQLLKINERFIELKLCAQDAKCTLPIDSLLCRNYIDYGEGCVAQIIDTLIEMDFYFTCTNYLNIIQSPHVVHDLRDAKLIALLEWAQTFDSIDEARTHPSLPHTLIHLI